MGTKRKPDQLPQPRTSMWDFIAYYLRYLRTKRGLSGEAMGQVMMCGKSKVSRIEIGEERLDWKQARLIDQAWETGGLFEVLVWYASVGHDPQWFAQYVEKEQSAKWLRIYEANVIPGLLQTEEYARALLSAGIETNRDQVLMERIQRQGILARPDPPHLTVILSQNALEWPVGSPDIMRDQLSYLMKLSESPDVVMRVVPRTWEVGAHAGLSGSFQLLSGDDFGEVAYTESPGAGRLVSSPPDVRSYGIRYDRISGKALIEEASRELIRTVMEGIT